MKKPMQKQFPLLCCLILLVFTFALMWPLPQHRPAIGAVSTGAIHTNANGTTIAIPAWQHVSTVWDDLPTPSRSTQQTASLIADLNNDGIQDFVIAARRNPGPSMVWYQRTDDGWSRAVIEQETLRIEAGGAVYDIDNDGDLDVVMGGDSQSNEIWWWENPYPVFNEGEGWTRRLIKASGAEKHHDMIFGDFDGDDAAEFVFWNQGANELRLAELPANPHSANTWPTSVIYAYQGVPHEGLAKADVNGDGRLDLIGGGRWFEYKGGTYEAHVVDDEQRFSRAAAAQLIPGGYAELVFVCGDCNGPLRWYEWNAGTWLAHELLPDDVEHGHTLEIGDINADGWQDIFVAEMRIDGTNSNAAAWLFFGDGPGSFVTNQLTTGFGHHESRLADLDGDGDLDILGKPYNWETPRLDIWLNQTHCTTASTLSLDQWRRHEIDRNRPWRALFVTSADVDQDGDQDVLTGAWWYANPGTPGGVWQQHEFGDGLRNLALVADLNGDGAIDVLGTAGRGSRSNADLLWAENDGRGGFVVHENIEEGDGDFLQGATLLTAGTTKTVVLSWHNERKALQQLTIPAEPERDMWPIQVLSETTQGEELSARDLDRDGDQDLLLGTQWLRNEANNGWTALSLAPPTVPSTAQPDRHRIADLNNDGRLDVVIGYEGVSEPARLAWYAQPQDVTTLWTEHIIDELIGPMSLDLRDMDGDGDVDVVVGEHNPANPATAGLYVYENRDGLGGTWQPHLIYQGDEHHDGAQIVDIDHDGDWDVISIGWRHDEVLLYENRSPTCLTQSTPRPTDSPSTTPTSLPSTTPFPTSTPTVDPGDRVTPDAPTSTPTATAAVATPITPPTIERQPADNEVYVGDDVTFGVNVISPGPVTYQWYRDATPIPNANGATFTLSSVTSADDTALFSCAVSNAIGTVHSRAARLRVRPEDERPDDHKAYLPHVTLRIDR